MKSFKETYEALKKNQSDAAVATKANLYKATLSRMKNETIPPNRNYLWALAMALELSINETEELFAACGLCMSSQYHLTDLEKEREKIIKECIANGKYNLLKLNIHLYEEGYRLLGNKGTN